MKRSKNRALVYTGARFSQKFEPNLHLILRFWSDFCDSYTLLQKIELSCTREQDFNVQRNNRALCAQWQTQSSTMWGSLQSVSRKKPPARLGGASGLIWGSSTMCAMALRRAHRAHSARLGRSPECHCAHSARLFRVQTKQWSTMCAMTLRRAHRAHSARTLQSCCSCAG